MCDEASFRDERKRKARKAHRCTECGREILPGESYTAGRMIWEGEWSTYKTCSRCDAMAAAIHAIDPYFCWTFGEMLEEARGFEFPARCLRVANGQHDKEISMEKAQRFNAALADMAPNA